MKLKKIYMQGFKSFADPTEIEIRDGVTAIIGPNGSGKSNIVDAVRWVLGEQSLKTLRGAKSKDIIFSGTKFRRSQAFAEVSITFDNSSDMLPIDYDEVKITRKLYRDGESGYYINGTKVRLKTVQELFMDTGVGKDGYSIIGQGRIDEILSNNSDERRKVFEEATGIVKYRERRKETLKNIESTNLNLVRINDILDEVNANLENLKVQSEKAIKFKVLKDEKKKLDLRVFKENIKIYDEKIKESKKKLSEALENVDLENKNSKELEKKLDKISSLISEIEKRNEDGYEVINSVIKEISEKEKQYELSEEKIKNISDNKSSYIKDIDTLKSKLETKKEDLSSKEAKKERTVRDSVSFKDMLKEKEELLASKKKILDDSRSNITEKKEERESLKDDIYEIDNNIYKKGLSIDSYLGRINMLKSELQNSKLKLDKKRMMIEDEKKKFVRDNKENIDQIKKLEAKKDKLNLKKEDREKLKSEISDLKTEIQILQKEKQINENLEREKDGFSYAVKQILKQKKSDSEIGKKTKGVIADLINVDEKYVSAIQTALGYSMQNVVVEDSNDADLIIDYLKEHKSGRATFLPVKSFSKYNDSGFKRRKEDLKRKIDNINFDSEITLATDVISIDEYYAPIINFLLKDSVIVDDMKSAIKLSKKLPSVKIITVSGDVINSSGSITGGYVNKKLNVLDRKNQIKKLSKEIRDKENRLKEDEKKYEEYIKKDENLEEMLRNIDSELSEKTIKLKVKEEKLLNEEKSKKDLENIIQTINSDISKIQSEIEKEKSEEKKMRSEKEKLASKLKTLEDEEKALIESSENSELSEEIEDISEDIMDLKISVGSFVENEKSLDEIINIIKSEIEGINLEISSKTEEITKGEALLDTLLKDKINIKEDIEQLKLKSVEIEGVKDDIKEERENALNEEKKLKEELSKVHEKLSEFVNKKLEYEQKLYREELKKDNLINNIWNEYNITYSNIQLDEKDEVFNEKGLNELDIDGNIISFDVVRAKKIADDINRKINELGSVNLESIEEYKALSERQEFLTKQKQDLDKTKASLKEVIRNVSSTMEEQFVERLKLINNNFNEIFSELFGGGKALITMEDDKDPLNSGVDIKVEPPGKKLQSLSLLSGGERAFTAIAILFAILKLNPSPFSVLDEIEAALDDANVQRFANYLNKYVKDSQFLVITHRKGTMANSQTIYGVTMEEKGISKLVSLDLNEVKKM